MRKLFLAASVIAALAFGGIAIAQQPDIDTVDLDEDDCTVIVEFNDGTQDTESIEVFVNDVRTHNIVFNDIVGDQSRTVAILELEEDDEVLARLTTSNEDEYEASLVVGECPAEATPTPTATATSTATPVPATPTPVPTVAPIPSPQVIIITAPAPTAVPTQIVTSSVRPPSTGDAGLAD